jgi:ABC-type molybdenum transport system ATPase subunit/photorepair protein PhrA
MISLDNGNFVAVLPVPSLSGALRQRNVLRKVAMCFWNTHGEAQSSTTSLVRRVLELREGGAGALEVPGRLGGREHFIVVTRVNAGSVSASSTEQRFRSRLRIKDLIASGLSSCVSIMLFA